MANHKNYRRKIIRESRLRVSHCPFKGKNGSFAYEKREWNQYVRQGARRFCRDFYRLNHILFSGYPEYEAVKGPVVYNKRPWLD